MTQISELSFEAAYEELAAIIQQLESGSLSLDDSVRLFERGRALSEHCQALLDKAELRVMQLTGSGEIEALNS
jgi:exodeoxyribonuclease VII small subunit